MKELIQFELKKIITSVFFKILIILVGLSTIAYYGYVYQKEKELYDQRVFSHEYWIGEYTHNIIENKELIDSGELENEERISLINENKFSEDQIIENELLFEAYRNKDWKTILEQRNQMESQFISMGGFSDDDEFFDQRHFTFAANLNRHKLVLERGITPILPIDYSITYHNFDETDDAEHRKAVKKGAIKYSESTLYYLLKVFSLSFSVIGVILFILLFGDIVTKEGIGRSGSIQLLYSQPIRRYQVIISKIVALITITIAIFGFVWLLATILGLVFDRFGDGNYPIMVYGDEFSFTFINLSTYLLRAMILFGLVLLFSYSLLFLLSFLTKRTLSAVGATIIIILLGTSIGTDKIIQVVAPYNPFNYFSVHDVITQELSVTLDNFKITYSTGIITLAISIILLWVVLLFMIKSKRFSVK